MPEPIAAYAGDGGGLRTSQGGYRVRIQEVGTETFRCSADFYLMSSDDAAVLGTDGGASLDVVAPNANSMAVAGEEYTVEVGWGIGRGLRPIAHTWYTGSIEPVLSTLCNTSNCSTHAADASKPSEHPTNHQL